MQPFSARVTVAVVEVVVAVKPAKQPLGTVIAVGPVITRLASLPSAVVDGAVAYGLVIVVAPDK